MGPNYIYTDDTVLASGVTWDLILTHTTKRWLKCSGLIITNLVSKGNLTPDLCYNDNMTTMPLTQISCDD